MIEKIKAFAILGEITRSYRIEQNKAYHKFYEKLDVCIGEAQSKNPWFTYENIIFALKSIGGSLTIDKLAQWLQPYEAGILKISTPKRVAVIMAGNIPLVGFHDFLSIVLSGHIFYGKLSSDDDSLLPGIVDILTEINPSLSKSIEFADGKMQNFDAVIATGSNNSSRYFDYYFGKYPNIIRKNRNGVAVLTGEETAGDLQKLGVDIFQYFGMGCRSISKLFVPKAYSFDLFFQSMERFNSIKNHHKYANNYDYYRSIYLINKVQHLDNGFLMITQDISYSSPPSVIYFEYYTDVKELIRRLESDSEQIQCIVSKSTEIVNSIPLGKAQQPELWDYADGVDTVAFLLKLTDK